MKHEIFIDGRPLFHTVFYSFGTILRNVIPLMAEEYKIVLLSDIIDDSEENRDVLNKVSDVINLGSRISGIEGTLAKYFTWEHQIVETYGPDFFWEIGSYLIDSFHKTISVVTLHDLFPLYDGSRKNFIRRIGFKFFVKRTIRNADAIVTPSKFTADELIRNIGIPKKYLIIPNGIPAPIELVNKPNVILPKEYTLYIGRLGFVKGTDILLDVYDRYSPQYKLVLSGKCVDNEIQQKLEALHQQGKVLYLGFTKDDEKEFLIRNAKYMIYPSRYDGFGIPPLEAAIRKVGVIMSNIPVLIETTQKRGVYFDISKGSDALWNVMQLVEGKTDAFNISDMYEIASGYSWEDYYLKMNELLMNLLEERQEG